MNRKSILALLAALSFSAILCTAVPKLAGNQEAPAALAQAAPATATLHRDAVASAPATAPATQSSAAQLREHAEQTRGIGTYITLFVILILSGLGLPLPEEVPLLLAGYMARHGSANLWILILVGLCGALSADVILFMATKRWRSHIFRWRWIRVAIRPRHLVLARRQFHNHGLKIVIVARWLPALRTAVCLTAGLTGVKFWRFLLVDATAACITVPTSILVGYYLADHIDRLIAGLVQVEHFVLVGVLAAVAVAVLIRFIWWHYSTRKARMDKSLPSQDGQPPAEEKTVGKHGKDAARREAS